MTNSINSALDSFRPTEPLPKALKGFASIRRYWDKDFQCYAAKILPGEYYVTSSREIIVTSLGSCISACIRDKVFGIGGMNHFMLPNNFKGNDESWRHRKDNLANRYGNYAMENLINDILKNGGRRENLEVKLFGGGKILAKMTDVGARNINFIEEYIKTERLDLVAKDLGSEYPRRVIYDPITGKAKVRKLKALTTNSIIERETRYLHDIQDSNVAGDIELFD